jgi:hypothetical protein
MRTTVDASTGRISPPTVLFDSPFTMSQGADLFRTQYDVTRDGRFLMVRRAETGDRVRVLLNVESEVRQNQIDPPK